MKYLFYFEILGRKSDITPVSYFVCGVLHFSIIQLVSNFILCDGEFRFLWKEGAHDEVIVAPIPMTELHSIFEIGKWHSSSLTEFRYVCPYSHLTLTLEGYSW